MLKRLCTQRPREWDRFITPLLFVYGETPHSNCYLVELFKGLYVNIKGTTDREIWEHRNQYQHVLDFRKC